MLNLRHSGKSRLRLFDMMLEGHIDRVIKRNVFNLLYADMFMGSHSNIKNKIQDDLYLRNVLDE